MLWTFEIDLPLGSLTFLKDSSHSKAWGVLHATDGTEGTDLTFAEFALSFGIDDVLNLSGSDTGLYTDLYII